jgi:hypothetical protein
MISKNVISSLFFLSNFLHLINKNNYYCLSFLLLLISSILYHSTKNNYILIVDKIFCYNIILTGLFFFLKRNKCDINTYIIIILFLFTIYIYVAGYYFSKYVFDKNLIIRENFHVLFHFTASLGHHIIIYSI